MLVWVEEGVGPVTGSSALVAFHRLFVGGGSGWESVRIVCPVVLFGVT